MKDNFARSLELVLKSEGKWSDDPRDPGGATMCGITIAVFSQYLCHPATKDELRKISQHDIEEIYSHGYWLPSHCNDLPNGVDYMVFDFAVNAGIGRAAKTLQAALGVTQDGILGPITMSVVGVSDPEILIRGFSDAKRVFYYSLRNFPTFGTGWLNRVLDVESNAKAMLLK